MTRRAWLWTGLGVVVAVTAALGVAMLVVEVGTTGIDPKAEYGASSKQIAERYRELNRTGRVRGEAELARLKSDVAKLLVDPGKIDHPVALTLPDRIARLIPHSVDPVRCKSVALANAARLGLAVSDGRQRPCKDEEPAIAGRCILDLLGALSRTYDRYCRPR
jgi:hypothetical protein